MLRSEERDKKEAESKEGGNMIARSRERNELSRKRDRANEREQASYVKTIAREIGLSDVTSRRGLKNPAEILSQISYIALNLHALSALLKVSRKRRMRWFRKKRKERELREERERERAKRREERRRRRRRRRQRRRNRKKRKEGIREVAEKDEETRNEGGMNRRKDIERFREGRNEGKGNKDDDRAKEKGVSKTKRQMDIIEERYGKDVGREGDTVLFEFDGWIEERLCCDVSFRVQMLLYVAIFSCLCLSYAYGVSVCWPSLLCLNQIHTLSLTHTLTCTRFCP